MSHIEVTGNKTFGVGDDGILQEVTANVVLTIPNDTTHKFVADDTIPVFNAHSSNVTFVCESGVTMKHRATATIEVDGYVTFRKLHDNEWVVWGDLVSP